MFRVEGLGLRVPSFGFRVESMGFRAQDYKVEGLGFGV